MTETFAVAAVALLALAGWASWMDRRRSTRAHLDRVGWVNWPLVFILALVGALMLAILAAKAG